MTENQGKAEKAFTNLGKKLDEMMADLQDLKENLKNKYGDRWQEINRSKDKLEDELNQFKEKHKDRFDEAERNIEKAGAEIKKAFETIFKSKSSTNRPQDPAPGEEKNSSEH